MVKSKKTLLLLHLIFQIISSHFLVINRIISKSLKHMIKILSTVMITCMFLFLSDLQAQDTIRTLENKSINDTLVYTIYGMDCPGCQQALEKQINKIPSVSYSKADWLNQELRIVLKQDSVINEKELNRRIKKANFTPGKKSENK